MTYKYPDSRYGENWNHLRFVIFERDGYICQRCGRYCKGYSDCHHIRPISKGGSNSMDNLITLCHDCHRFISLKRYL